MANYGEHADCYPPGHSRGGPCGPACPYNRMFKKPEADIVNPVTKIVEKQLEERVGEYLEAEFNRGYELGLKHGIEQEKERFHSRLIEILEKLDG